ncbi:nicotinate-nucleotide pyrophosphorylase [carboxylating] [Natranaerovirga pectinivora]|uniref:Probable nicotinate-nucleotide pyrophosphorylase [carboxylating] n=1 Tax=Natranaerovirga pectinivora TaxID=682400 RepID=A0A4R3MLV3_9FIRM|nr:carboxylating nicotinate-nucleotide diphosphorylase [Natranaerovirga pectinivora]TCT13851.1 nicotinate-nucleotide pyrophosphorylase [carboxylating] [Natranaerovirga pectinivora]
MFDAFLIDTIINRALEEDIGTGDVTTLSTVSKDHRTKGNLIAKEEGIICGLEVFKKVFHSIDSSVLIHLNFFDGEKVSKGDIIGEIVGNTRAILTGERVALNFLQRLSGIATKTNELVQKVKGTNAKIIDTRKTTPGLRVLEKYAVKVGGGLNHRHNLSDGILIKDNHISAAGGIKKAIALGKSNAPHTLKIEVEVESIEGVKEGLEAGVDIIMLDNMSVDMMEEAVRLIGKRALIEASGNMGDKELLSVAKTGVDFISVGALTHTIRSLDISLRLNNSI